MAFEGVDLERIRATAEQRAALNDCAKGLQPMVQRSRLG
jgi:hypothetical protein